ncbi:plasmid mobilization relaxosome protein MobC [Mucilaginibacter sabulilitoris]|uniref:Plasmid mobilization relaxosome protein MobC n=1 Tax=Mucilaginibacter sabulilitoris TaxID=1173583 RepID=A0ABZ0TTP0_9SPHI|nr:plasmid mobilization relaxosome protein MobC [Mucilaginibacter sabulilitoris]WPU96478.1 plasmid mobilization relaxosome protein MobC [Mucilaginibacter sabulilitoris]
MNGRGRTKGRRQMLAGKRIKKIDTRFTEDEYQIICELEKTLGLTKTELVRQRLLSNAGLLVVNAKELIVLLDQVGSEMGRCGNNINQLAKYANILKKRGMLSPVVIERFNVLFEQYLKNQQALNTSLRKVFRITGA